MRKITSLLMLLFLFTGIARADFSQPYSNNAEHWNAVGEQTLATDLQTIVTTHNCTGTLYYGYNEVIVSADGDITVTLDYTGGSDMIAILGVEFQDASGNVVKADYHYGTSGGKDVDNVYTLSSVPTGEYVAKYYVCSKPGDHDLTATNGQVIFTGNITEKTTTPEAISTEYYYQIKNVAYSRMLSANENKATVTSTSDVNDVNQLWAFEVGEDGTYYLRNAGQAKYLGYNGTNSQCWSMDATQTAAFTLEVMKAPTAQYSTTYYAIKKNDGDEYSCAHDANWNTAGEQVVRWLASASASQWILIKTEVPATAQEVSFTYSLKFGGVEKFTQTCTGFVGEEYPAVNVSLPFGINATKPAGEITSAVDGTTIDIELTETLPFVYAADYASVTNWYYLKIKNESYLSYVENQEYIDLANKSAVDSNNKDAYTWAFIGNPFDGYQLVNKAAGATKILSSSTTIDGDGANTYPILTETPVADGNNTTWSLTTGYLDIENGFYMAQTGFASNKMNNRDNKLAYWTGGADAGSTFMVEERDMTGRTELQALVDAIEAANYTAGDAIGYYTQASVDAVNAAVAAAKTALAGEMTDAISTEHQTAINNAVAALDLIKPTPGKFYVLRCAYQDRRVYVNADNKLNWIENASANTSEAKYVWQFETAADGKFKMKSVETQSYLNTVSSGAAITLGAEGADVTISAGAVTGTVKFEAGNAGVGIHANANPITGWTNGAESNHYWVEEVDAFSHTLTVGEAGWSTLILGYNATIPANVEVYAVSEVTSADAKLTPVTGAIPAGEAVLVKATAGDYVFDYAASANAVATNLLEGTLFNSPIAKAAWILGLNEGVVGLYTVTLDQAEGTAFTNNAFKAYLPKTSTEGALRLEIGTTGIENAIVGENGNAVIFDLSGRRVAKMQKGIYIVNGKKVLVK